jgi:hypothetical protein
MLVLRKRLLEISDANRKRLMESLHLDVEPNGYRGQLMRLFKKEMVISKPWIGTTKVDEVNFSVMATKRSYLGAGINSIIVRGKCLDNANKNFVQICYGVSWLQIVWLYATIFFFGFFLSSDFWGLVICCGLAAIHFLYLLNEVNRSDSNFTDYFLSFSNDKI